MCVQVIPQSETPNNPDHLASRLTLPQHMNAIYPACLGTCKYAKTNSQLILSILHLIGNLYHFPSLVIPIRTPKSAACNPICFTSQSLRLCALPPSFSLTLSFLSALLSVYFSNASRPSNRTHVPPARLGEEPGSRRF